MTGYLIFLLLLAVGGISQHDALEKPRLPDCRKVMVQDSDRRSFDDRTPFTLDVDGDGRPDTITPRTYAQKINRRRSGRLMPEAREIHWITFDMKTSRGRALKSFFKYDYGTDEGDYWVYALIPCRVGGGRTGLLFYSGDDTSDETVILENRGNTFKVQSRKVVDVE
jgi:hypothetical protein